MDINRVTNEEHERLVLALKYWVDAEQRMEIARGYGITTTQHINRILRRPKTNWSFFRTIVQRAFENKELLEKARQLERPAA